MGGGRQFTCSLKNVLDEAAKIINFIKFQPWSTHLLIFCDKMGNTCNCFYILKNDGYLEKRHLCNWIASWTSCFYHEIQFLFWRTVITQTCVFGRHFLQMNGVFHSLQGKLTLYVVNDKIWVLTPKLEFWITCICYHETESFPVLKRCLWWDQWWY